jgi:tRNA(fMet)-specific endonuclease VapC
VRPALVDTDILSLFFRGHPAVVDQFKHYTAEQGCINLSIVTYYEILSGLMHRDARRQLTAFLEFVAMNNLVLLTEESVRLSAEVYVMTRAKGNPVDDIDILIAGVALANDWLLITHNRRHFEKIDGLSVVDWSESIG